MKDMRIVFMGTPDFAAAILKRLIDTGRNVVGVFSQPDKPVGRKQVIIPTATKALAMEYGIEVIPTLFYFKDGKIAKKSVGLMTKAEILAEIDKL